MRCWGSPSATSEAEPSWKAFLRSLADRGLRGVELVVADERPKSIRSHSPVRDETGWLFGFRSLHSCANRRDRCTRNVSPWPPSTL